MSDSQGRLVAASSGATNGLRELMQGLPLPLAQLVRRALNGKSAVERHHGAFYVAECALKLAAAARIGLWMDRALVPGSDLAQRLESLVLPSLGHWCAFLREVDLALGQRADVALLPFAGSAAELSRKRPDLTRVTEFAHRSVAVGVLGAEPSKQALRRGVLGFFDLVVAYRNEVIGHGAQRTNAFYDEFARLLLDATAEVLAERALFGGLALAEARFELDGQTSRTVWYALTGLAGLAHGGGGGGGEGDGDDAGDAIPGHLYLIGNGARVPLHPLVVYRYEDELGREQVGFLNRTSRRKAGAEGGADVVHRADYLDYASGQTLEGIDARAALTTLLSRLKGHPATPADLDAAANATRTEAAEEPTEAAVSAGAVIGDFELQGELGRGSMGVVYKARQRSLGRIVALKVLPPSLAASPVARARFKKEITALARCDHPNVVRILATGSDDRHDYYAMEHVDGVDLTHVPPGRHLEGRLAELFAGAADGLAHLHENKVLHRDLKPGNLMLTADGRRLVIMDLGLAKLADESQALTSADVKILGTLRYMAPEQLQRRLVDVDARADVYGLGAALYELATGRPIHDGDTEQRLVQQVLNEEPMPPRRAAPSLRSDLATVITKAIAKLPAHRYATANDFADDLRAVASNRPIRAKPPGPAARTLLWARRNRTPLAAALAALVVIGAGALATWSSTRLQIRYYTDLVDHAGVLEGVFEVDGVTGRNVTRKVLSRGGRVIAVEFVNGYGALAESGVFSAAEFHYGDDGKVAYRVERTTTGRFVAKYVYSYKGRVMQVLRQDRSDLPQPESGDVTMYRYELDDRGFDRKVTFFNDRGSPRQSVGVYGYQQTVDARGQPAVLTFLDADGSPFVRTDGVARAEIHRDKAGQEVERAFFAVDGKPALHSSGAAVMRQRYDARGNLIERAFFGADSRPTAQKDGYAIMRSRFDEHGCLVEKSFYGPDERPALVKVGFATVRSKCDDHGREIERAHFGIGGEPVVIRPGFSAYHVRYDDHGNEIERSFFGGDGLPMTNAGGAAIVRTRFDDRGNVVEVTSLGVDGRPTVVKAGRAIVRYQYDDRDNESEVAYFGADGARIVAQDGCALWRARHDDRGKEIEKTCVGVDEKPKLGPEGWATVRTRFDDHGKPVERAYFGAGTEPVLHKDGYAVLRIEYDDRGNEGVRTYSGKSGLPLANAEGFAVWRGKYDERGRVIKESYFGADGGPVASKHGAAVRKTSYDAHGNVAERAYFDGGGKATLGEEGFAIERSTYDGRDNEIERRFFGVGGEPVVRKGGYAAWRVTYDEGGKVIEKVYLDLQGNRVVVPEGA